MSSRLKLFLLLRFLHLANWLPFSTLSLGLQRPLTLLGTTCQHFTDAPSMGRAWPNKNRLLNTVVTAQKITQVLGTRLAWPMIKNHFKCTLGVTDAVGRSMWLALCLSIGTTSLGCI
jgi:hypothetical protein